MTNKETARVITTNENSFAGIPDMENGLKFIREAEKAGIDSVLMSFGNYEPDTLQVACALGRESSKIKFIVAYRLGLMQPTLFVQQVNTLSALIGGRVALNIIAGSSPAEQRGYGDFLNHDERYERADEFLSICNAFWGNEGVVDFKGKYCSLEGGKLHTPFLAPDRKSPEIYVSGHSEGAKKLVRNQGSCWVRLIDTPENIAPLVSELQEHNIETCLRLCVICRPTKEEAIVAGEALVEDCTTIGKVRQFINSSDSDFLKHSLAVADKGGWLNQNLWAGLVPSYGPSVMTLIGTPEELAEKFMEYKRIGVTQFIIAGWPKLEEMIIFGREVMPLIRKQELTEENFFILNGDH